VDNLALLQSVLTGNIISGLTLRHSRIRAKFEALEYLQSEKKNDIKLYCGMNDTIQELLKRKTSLCTGTCRAGVGGIYMMYSHAWHGKALVHA
jgi:transketolase